MIDDDIDRRLAQANFVPDDVEAPDFELVLRHIAQSEEPPRRRRPAWRRPLLALVIGFGLTATATAAVVAATTALDARSTVHDASAARLTALVRDGRPRPVTTAERELAPELGDAGPVRGTTLEREGFLVDIAFDDRTLCLTGHVPGQRSGLNCTRLPLSYDMLPTYAGGDGEVPDRTLFAAVAPDGIDTITVTTASGDTRTVPFVDNVATATFAAEQTIREWRYTTPDGRTIVDG